MRKEGMRKRREGGKEKRREGKDFGFPEEYQTVAP